MSILNMETFVINTIEDYEAVRDAWEDIYSLDPLATIHRSWSWLRSWIESTPYSWFVLALKLNVNSPYVAFFPLAINKGRSELYLGGHPLSAHTGLLCVPGHTDEVIHNISFFIQKNIDWRKFIVRDFIDPRIESLANQFTQNKYQIEHLEPTVCPYLKLPDTWDDYLMTVLSAKARRNLRRALKDIELLEGFHVIETHDKNFERQLNILLTQWQNRWEDLPSTRLNMCNILLRNAFKHNILRLVTYWNNDVPIGAKARFIDRNKNIISGFMDTWNKDCIGIRSPGHALSAIDIKYAIENGFDIHDFGRGGESYKFELGAKSRFNSNLIISKAGFRKRIRQVLKRRIELNIG